ncbi:hypothetical protein BH10PSE17_BH10PSE17_33850 [soil metagenome]
MQNRLNAPMDRFLRNESSRQVLAHLQVELDRAQRHEDEMLQVLAACASSSDTRADADMLKQRVEDASAVTRAAQVALQAGLVEHALEPRQPD